MPSAPSTNAAPRSTLFRADTEQGIAASVRSEDGVGHRGLSAFPEALRKTIWQQCHAAALPQSRFVFAQGDSVDLPGQGLFFVVSGQFEVSNSGAPGVQHILSVLGPGSMFGAVGLAEGGVRPVSVRSLSSARLRCLPRERFLALMAESGFAATMASLHARKVASLTSVYNQAVSGDALLRLARRLVLLAQEDDAFGPVVQREFLLSQDMLANMLGISRQWVSLHLQTLQESGALQLGYRRVFISDLEALRRAARLDERT